MTVFQCIQNLKEKLESTSLIADKNAPTVELLLTSAIGWKPLEWVSRKEYELSTEQIHKVFQCFERSQKGEPLAYIIGLKEFFGLKFKVNPNVLIPRDETEILVEHAIARIKGHFKNQQKGQRVKVADLGCGSGCIGVAVANFAPGVEVSFFDKSEKALEVAKENAKKHGVDNSSSFCCEELSKESLNTGDYDLILSNPPYIANGDQEIQQSVMEWEPSMALFAPEKGLKYLWDWLEWSYTALRKNGMVIFEHGWKQYPELERKAEALGYINIKSVKDYSGHRRFIVGEK